MLDLHRITPPDEHTPESIFLDGRPMSVYDSDGFVSYEVHERLRKKRQASRRRKMPRPAPAWYVLPANPLVKCLHCGHWGAVYTPCRHCGAPVDPEV